MSFIGIRQMKIISGYMNDEKYRHLLNDLTRKVFGFDFENWVTQGYFEGDYIPYSFLHDGKIVSNVSANIMRFSQNGEERNYIQIGTVMTDENFRNHGLAGKLMQHVIRKYEKKSDGIYLFGALSAKGFYQKMGFFTENQYHYYVKNDFCHTAKAGTRFRQVMDTDTELKAHYMDLVRKSAFHSSFEQLNKFGLQMFYTSGLDNVYYADDIDCFIVLNQDDGAVLGSVLCREDIGLQEILCRIKIQDDRIRLGFTPRQEDKYMCDAEIYDGGEDYRLFYRGKQLQSIERDKLYFPDLSHA